MAMTVTATMSGTAANEHIYLWIRVLTGATEAGGASAAGIAASGGAGVTATLTPNFSSSLPCYALSGDNSAGPLTAAGSNTIDSSSADPDTWEAGFGRYTGTVTAATPLTFGASSFGVGGCDYGTWACYEVPSSGGGTPAVDASSPALASATGAGIKTVTSASFTPPAGAVVVAMVVGGGTGSSGSFAMAVSGGGLTWTQRAGTATVTDQDTFVFTATVPGAGPVQPPQPQPGSRNWRLRHRRRQQMVPASLAGQPVAGAATLAGTGSISTAAVQSAGATLAGTGSIAASPGPPVITGLAGGASGYFADQGGNPRLVWGDAVWALCGNVGRWSSGAWQADYDTYFATRAAQGVNVLYTKPMGTQQSGNIDNNGGQYDGTMPFTGGAGANPSTGLNSAFWSRIDYMLTSAAGKGITVFLNAIGYSSDFDSGPGPLAGKSTTEFQAYGAALGARYASTPNLVWTLADDYFSDNDTLITAFLTGLRGAGDTHPVAIENMPESTSRQLLDGTDGALAWGTAHAQFNFVYSYNAVYWGVERAYTADGSCPPVAGDGYFYQGSATYAGGSGAFAFDRAFRQDAWHALSSGARGKIHGDEAIWQWQTGSQSAASTGWFWAHSALAIRTAFEGLTGWQNLIPDTSSAFITAGRGTHASAFSSGGGGGQYEVAFTDSYVTGSITADGSLAVVYLSHGTTITIDQGKLASGYTATWIDPVSGATSPATTGSTYNSTAKGNNSAGDPDWVLAFQAPVAVTVSGAATLSGTGTLAAPAVVTFAAAASLSGSGALAAVRLVTQPAAAALSGSGALTAAAAVAFASAASLSGSGSLAATALVTQPAAASLSGSGVLAAAGSVAFPVAAALAGSGSLGAQAAVAFAPAVALSGSGTLAAPRSVQFPGAAALSGSGTLAAAGLVTFAPAGAFSGTGALAGAGTVTQPAAASLSGSGSLAVSASVQFTSAAALAGSGALAATGLAVVPAAAALSGTGSLAVAASVQFTAAASLAGQGTLAAPALVTQPAAAALAGTGSLGAAISVQFTSGAALAGSGTLTAAGSVSGLTTAGAALSGSGALAAAALVQFAASAALSGSGTFSSAATVGVPASAALAGSGSLAAAAFVAVPAAASLSGLGVIAASVTVSAPSGAALSGSGSLTAGAVLTVTAAASLAGLGVMTVSVQVVTPATEPPVLWSVQPAALRWRAAPAPPRWTATPSPVRWRVLMALFPPIAAISLEEVNVTWESSLAGTSVDPTGASSGQPALPVQFAFPQTSGNYQAPAQPVTWFTGSWLLGGTSIGYVSQCLVGPGGGVVTLAAGLTYDVHSKILGNPESPVKFAGTLSVF